MMGKSSFERIAEELEKLNQKAESALEILRLAAMAEAPERKGEPKEEKSEFSEIPKAKRKRKRTPGRTYRSSHKHDMYLTGNIRKGGVKTVVINVEKPFALANDLNGKEFELMETPLSGTGIALIFHEGGHKLTLRKPDDPDAVENAVATIKNPDIYDYCLKNDLLFHEYDLIPVGVGFCVERA